METNWIISQTSVLLKHLSAVIPPANISVTNTDTLTVAPQNNVVVVVDNHKVAIDLLKQGLHVIYDNIGSELKELLNSNSNILTVFTGEALISDNIKNLIDKDIIGEVYHVHFKSSVLNHNKIATMYLFMQNIFGNKTKVVSLRNPNKDALSVALEFSDKKLATLVIDSRLKLKEGITVTGSKGQVVVDIDDNGDVRINAPEGTEETYNIYRMFVEKTKLKNRCLDIEKYLNVLEVMEEIDANPTEKLTSNIRPTRWGIVSVGKISTDFTTALLSLPRNEHQLIGVASKSLERSQEFAAKFNINHVYGSYGELALDPDVDVVYIGSINTEHLKLGKLFLKNGKHVLCEKPLCVNLKETQELINTAKENNLFLMEAIWSRFFPATDFVKKQIRTNCIGDVKQIIINFAGVTLGVKDRVMSKELGGSVLLDIGVYAIQFILYIFGKPDIIKASGALNTEGVDEASNILFLYQDGKMATISLHSRVNFVNEARVYGSDGEVIVHEPFWCPTRVTLPSGVFDFPLPRTNGVFRYKNSAGLCYEADEVRRCILAGLNQSPVLSWKDSLEISEIEEEIRRQLGALY